MMEQKLSLKTKTRGSQGHILVITYLVYFNWL